MPTVICLRNLTGPLRGQAQKSSPTCSVCNKSCQARESLVVSSNICKISENRGVCGQDGAHLLSLHRLLWRKERRTTETADGLWLIFPSRGVLFPGEENSRQPSILWTAGLSLQTDHPQRYKPIFGAFCRSAVEPKLLCLLMIDAAIILSILTKPNYAGLADTEANGRELAVLCSSA